MGSWEGMPKASSQEREHDDRKCKCKEHGIFLAKELPDLDVSPDEAKLKRSHGVSPSFAYFLIRSRYTSSSDGRVTVSSDITSPACRASSPTTCSGVCVWTVLRPVLSTQLTRALALA